MAAYTVDLRKWAGVGRGIPKDLADNLRQEVEGTRAASFYQDSSEYPFEAIDSDAIAGVVKPVVDTWLSVCIVF